MTMSDSGRIFLDTNILIQANVLSAPLHGNVLNALQILQQSNTDLWISRQVLREYIATVTRPQSFMQPMNSAKVIQRIRYFETHFQVADDISPVTDRLLTLIENIPVGGKQIHDANIVATMQAYGIERLFTLNIKDFTRFAPQIALLTLENVLQQIDDPSE